MYLLSVSSLVNKCQYMLKIIHIPRRILNNLQTNFNFKWASSHIKNLGILLSMDLSTIYTLIFLHYYPNFALNYNPGVLTVFIRQAGIMFSNRISFPGFFAHFKRYWRISLLVIPKLYNPYSTNIFGPPNQSGLNIVLYADQRI